MFELPIKLCFTLGGQLIEKREKLSLVLSSANITQNEFKSEFSIIMVLNNHITVAYETYGEICSSWHEGGPDWAFAPPNF